MEIKASIIDYIGKYEDGILVSVGLMYDKNFFDSIFYYTNDQMIINVDEKMIENLGCYIEEHPYYQDLMIDIINKVEPYEKIIDQLDEIKTINE
jgi:hypothetical protein